MRSIFVITVSVSMFLLTMPGVSYGQAVPGNDENIPYLMTFGKDGHETSWGDDDFSETFFFTIPKEYKEPFFILGIVTGKQLVFPEIALGLASNKSVTEVEH